MDYRMARLEAKKFLPELIAAAQVRSLVAWPLEKRR